MDPIQSGMLCYHGNKTPEQEIPFATTVADFTIVLLTLFTGGGSHSRTDIGWIELECVSLDFLAPRIIVKC
jgi:hypothetical protein